MANLQVTVEAELDEPPEKVFPFLADPEKMPLWMSGVESAEWAQGSAPVSGGRFSMRYRYARRVNDITMEITAVEPNMRFEYHTVEGSYPIEASFNVRPNNGGAFVTYTQNALSDSKMAALGFMLSAWFAKPMMRRALRKDLVKLGDAVRIEKPVVGDVDVG